MRLKNYIFHVFQWRATFELKTMYQISTPTKKENKITTTHTHTNNVVFVYF